MKHRWIALLLCLALLITPILAGCSSKTDEEVEDDIRSDASESAVTLSMWLVSKSPVSAETVAAISERVNAVTNAKYKTKVVLKYFTESEYRSMLERTIRAYEVANGITEGEDDGEEPAPAAPTEDQTEVNEYGMSVIKYPDLVENQVDIIYLAGEDMYLDLIDNKWLRTLDTEMTTSAGKIAEYTSANLLAAAKQNGVTYAIPNNNAIGSYTYMLFDKSLLDAPSFNAYILKDTIDGFFHRDVYSCLSYYAKDASVVTIDNDVIGSDESAYDLCRDLLAHYWNVKGDLTLTGDFSVFGHNYNEGDVVSRGKIALTYENLFANEAFRENYLHLEEMRLDGYFGNGNGKSTLLRFAVGDQALLDEYHAKLPGLPEREYEDAEYYAVPILTPVATSEDIYSNMFGVCRYTKNLSRSMQIITLLNTDADFRNLLQYGIEDVHYKFVGDDVVQSISDDYKMDLAATGNEFLAYRTPDMPEDIWENGKKQNRASSISPLLGFDMKSYAANGHLADTELAAYLFSLDEGLKGKLAAVSSKAQLEALTTEIANLLNADGKEGKSDFTLLASFIDQSVIKGDLATLRKNLARAYSSVAVTVGEGENARDLESPNALYCAWMSEFGFTPAE